MTPPSKPPAIKKPDPPAPVAIPATPPDQIITGGEHSPTEYFQNYLGVKEERLKYPSLQDRGLIYITLTPELANQVIEVLEKTDWNQSDYGRLVFWSHFYMNNSGLFAFFAKIYEDKKLESDKIEDLIYIRDNLKRVVPGLITNTGKMISSFRKPVGKKA